MAEQEVGAVHILRVDRRHDEWRGPGAGRAVIFGHHAGWLRRAFKAGGEGKAALEEADDLRVLGGGLHRFGKARNGAAGGAALHLADAALDARGGLAVGLDRLLLEEPDAEIERDRVKPAGKDDARAARLRRIIMRVDHLAHPRRFAAQVDIVGAGLRTGGDELRAVQLIGADRRDDDAGARAHEFQARGVVGIGDHEGRFGGQAHLIADFGELRQAAAAHRPARDAARGQIFRDKPAGKAACAIDDDVKLCVFARHVSLPPVLVVSVCIGCLFHHRVEAQPSCAVARNGL